MRDYIIYKITNLINRKIYIGRTTQLLKTRWDAHRNGITAGKNKHLKLYKAFKKYGIENFKIEQIDRTNSFEKLRNLEGEYILKFQSYKDEIGYNMSIDTNKGLELLSEESINRRRKSIHKANSKRRVAKYGIGVRFSKGIYSANICFHGEQYYMAGDSIESAKIIYDKLAIYFYKEDAELNFPNIKYTEEEILNNYNKCIEHKNLNPTSKYIGVYHKDNLFMASLSKNKKMYIIGSYKTEKEAALAVDKARYYLRPEDPLKKYNFLDKISEYKNLDIKSWFESTQISREMGVVPDWRIKKFAAKVSVNNKYKSYGYFDSKEDAAIRRDLVVLYYKLNQPLNYPEKIEEYNKKYKIEIENFLSKKKKYKGLFYRKDKDLYCASIVINKKTHYFGSSHDQIEAAKIFDKGCYELLHDLSKLNFPELISDSIDYQI